MLRENDSMNGRRGANATTQSELNNLIIETSALGPRRMQATEHVRG